MKKLTIIFFILIILVCSCKREPFEWENKCVGIKTSGEISVPANIDQTGWEIRSGMNIGTVSNGIYTINLNENAVQLLTVLNKEDKPVLFSVDVTHSVSSGNTLSPESTAEALVFLNPFFCTSDPTEATELKEKIKTLVSFNNLVSTINSELKNGSFSISETNSILIIALDSVYKDLTSQFNSKKSLSSSNSDFKPSPDFEVNGLKIVDVQQTSNELSFIVANRAKRWISVYVDKSTDGRSFTPSASPVDLIPSPSISIWNLITQGFNFPTVYSTRIQSSTSGYQKYAIKCYGLGVLNDINDEEFSRAILPAAMSVVFDLGVPIYEVVTGLNLSAELRGRPANHPFYKLMEKTSEAILKDLVLKARLYSWYREGDIVKIVVGITNSMFSTCIKEPSLIAQILTNIVGKEVASSVVNQFLFPIRLLNATFTAANLGYTLGSVISTEAVTDFKFDKTSTTMPVFVIGNIKSFADGGSVSGASVTSFDVNGNVQQGAITDASGFYTLNSNTGYIKLRVVANGYKPTNQVLQIPSDIVSNSPPNYYAPTTWLSDYSGEKGDIGGFVKDATNLNPISGTTIEIRAGENDMSREVVQQVISGSDGSFTFSEIPSGTYTAFFSKAGYINDFLVLSVLGGQETSGFSMYLSPDIRASSGFRIVLTWGEDPRDLDSHLFTPDIYGSNYHVYYHSPGDIINPPFASLDTDDRYSYGPETVTIDKTFSGEYYYSVHHYEGIGSLTSTSNATVNLYGVDGFIRSWTVPSTGDGYWWNVFSVNGSTGNITNINQISASAPASYKSMAVEHIKNMK